MLCLSDPSVIVVDPAVRAVYDAAARVARGTINVLVLGAGLAGMVAALPLERGKAAAGDAPAIPALHNQIAGGCFS